MSTLSEVLIDFGAQAPVPVGDVATVDENALEAAKLDSFEGGYRAGWDDAIKNQTEDHARISSDFSQSLQDLSFTYHEAYSQVLNGIAPLLEEMVRSLLPAVLQQTLGQHVQEQLMAMAQEIGAREVVIAVAPGCAATIKPLLSEDFGFSVQLHEDGTLAEGQADIRFAETERQIDLSGLLQDVTQAVQGFVHDNRREVANG